jgi:hypothetical protein
LHRDRADGVHRIIGKGIHRRKNRLLAELEERPENQARRKSEPCGLPQSNGNPSASPHIFSYTTFQPKSIRSIILLRASHILQITPSGNDA